MCRMCRNCLLSLPEKSPKRDMGLTVAALMKESHTGESAYLTGKGFAGYPASLTGSVQHISGKDFPAGSLLLPLTTNTGAVTGAQLIAPTGEKHTARQHDERRVCVAQPVTV